MMGEGSNGDADAKHVLKECVVVEPVNMIQLSVDDVSKSTHATVVLRVGDMLGCLTETYSERIIPPLVQFQELRCPSVPLMSDACPARLSTNPT